MLNQKNNGFSILVLSFPVKAGIKASCCWKVVTFHVTGRFILSILQLVFTSERIITKPQSFRGRVLINRIISRWHRPVFSGWWILYSQIMPSQWPQIVTPFFWRGEWRIQFLYCCLLNAIRMCRWLQPLWNKHGFRFIFLFLFFW